MQQYNPNQTKLLPLKHKRLNPSGFYCKPFNKIKQRSVIMRLSLQSSAESPEIAALLENVRCKKVSLTDEPVVGYFRSKWSKVDSYASPPVLTDSYVRFLWLELKKQQPNISKEAALKLIKNKIYGSIRRDRFLKVVDNSSIIASDKELYCSPPVLKGETVIAITKEVYQIAPEISMLKLYEFIVLVTGGAIKYPETFRKILQQENLWEPKTALAQKVSVTLRDLTKQEPRSAAAEQERRTISKGKGCAACGLTEHNGVSIYTIGEIDHVYGRNNSSITRLLCPSCHNQTITKTSNMSSFTKGEATGLVTVPDVTHDFSKINMLEKLTGHLQRRLNRHTGEAYVNFEENKQVFIQKLESGQLQVERSKNSRLLDHLLGYKIFDAKCNQCNITEWRGLPISPFLELHHIDGINTNNTVANLIPLCGNCHASLHRISHDRAAELEAPLKSSEWNDLSYEELLKHFEEKTAVVMPRIIKWLWNHPAAPKFYADRGRLLGYNNNTFHRLMKKNFPSLWQMDSNTVRYAKPFYLDLDGCETLKRLDKLVQKAYSNNAIPEFPLSTLSGKYAIPHNFKPKKASEYALVLLQQPNNLTYELYTDWYKKYKDLLDDQKVLPFHQFEYVVMSWFEHIIRGCDLYNPPPPLQGKTPKELFDLAYSNGVFDD